MSLPDDVRTALRERQHRRLELAAFLRAVLDADRLRPAKRLLIEEALRLTNEDAAELGNRRGTAGLREALLLEQEEWLRARDSLQWLTTYAESLEEVHRNLHVQRTLTDLSPCDDTSEYTLDARRDSR